MDYVNHAIESQSPRYCFSIEDYGEATREFYSTNNTLEEKIIPDWLYLPSFDECEKYREFVDDVCSHHRPHRLLITCNYCQKDFNLSNNGQLRCSSCCRLIEQKLKTYFFEKFKNLANVYNMKKRRTDYMIDELVQKVQNYIS